MGSTVTLQAENSQVIVCIEDVNDTNGRKSINAIGAKHIYNTDSLYHKIMEKSVDDVRDFVDWIKEENLIEEYGIKILNNPDENYRHKNEELDELSYLRTLIAHFNDQDAEKYKREYEEMINRDMRIIIEIIKAYK